MTALRYWIPFGFLALVPLGAWLGGTWSFLVLAALPLALITLDGLLGEETAEAPADVPVPQ